MAIFLAFVQSDPAIIVFQVLIPGLYLVRRGREFASQIGLEVFKLPPAPPYQYASPWSLSRANFPHRHRHRDGGTSWYSGYGIGPPADASSPGIPRPRGVDVQQAIGLHHIASGPTDPPFLAHEEVGVDD